MKKYSMGKHILLEIYDVEFEILNTLDPLIEVVEESIRNTKMTILNTYSYQFSPQGLTILVCLAESHVSLHTFPENNCVSIDCYTCGDTNPNEIAQSLIDYFSSENYQIRELSR